MLEEVFKEPVRAKESIAKEELKSEDFSLILTQWKASTNRKAPLGLAGGLGGAASKLLPGAGRFGEHIAAPHGKFSIVPPGATAVAGVASEVPGMTPAVSTVVTQPTMLPLPGSAEANGAATGTSPGHPADDKMKKATLFWKAMKDKGNQGAALVFLTSSNRIIATQKRRNILWLQRRQVREVQLREPIHSQKVRATTMEVQLQRQVRERPKMYKLIAVTIIE